MKKYIFSFAFVFSYLFASTQVSFQIANANGNKNDTVSVQVATTGFNNVLGMQYSINYDSNVLAIVDLTKTAAFDVDYSTHVGSATVKNGQITFSWSPPGGVGNSIANGTVIFTMRFKLIGKECDSSFVKVTGKPTPIDVFDGNFNTLTLTANDGKVKINGSGCVVGPPPDTTGGFQIIASMETSPKGIVKCIKVTSKNFKNIASAQLSMRWDKAIATFDTLNSGAMVLIPNLNYISTPDRGGVGLTWDSGPNPVDIADGTTLFEVCLKPVGAPGTFTDINFINTPILIEFTNGNSDIVTPKLVAGKLTITDAPAETLKLYVRDTSVDNCGEFCVPVRVDNFKCVQSFQFSIKFDSTKLKFKRVSGINLPGFTPLNFYIIKDSIRVQWDASTGAQTRANGDSIFMICFESLLFAPNCPFDTKFTFTDLINSPLGFTDCNDKDFTILKGEPDFTVKCCPVIPPLVIKRGTDSPVKCFGDCNGSIKGTAVTSGGKGPFGYEWKLQPFNIVVSSILEPNDLCPGIYKLCVTDKGNANLVTSPTFMDTITSPKVLSATAIVTHEVNGADGAIDLIPDGGVLPYKFRWRRLSSGTVIDTINEDLKNRPANDYEITLTDVNGCIFKDTFTINPKPFKIVSVTKIDSNRCFGNCRGSLFVSAGGGKIPYKYIWSNGDTVNPADSLCKGTYTVTATDAAGTTSTATYTITEPDEIVITTDSIIKSSGLDGKVYITPKGGTPYRKPGSPSYTYQWKNAAGAVISTEEDLKNAPPGTYTVCVTDTLLCVKCDSAIVTATNVTPPTITVSLAIDPKLGGNAVSCHGKCDGKITASVVSTDPKLPYKYRWSHDTTLNASIVTNLCPGIYSLTVTDKAGNTKASSPITIVDAPTITLTTKKINCASSSTAADGEYEAIISGAVPPISYRWCNGDINQTAKDLPPGNCSVQITDANGCTDSESFLVCLKSIEPNVDCYQGRLAISPNGDGFNDVFKIACVTDFDNLLNIYDRWGNIVYSKTNYTNDWDGLNKDGETLTEGTYMWVLKVKEPGKEDAYYKGTVTIVR